MKYKELKQELSNVINAHDDIVDQYNELADNYNQLEEVKEIAMEELHKAHFEIDRLNAKLRKIEKLVKK